jgi:hypothetical protein
MPWIGRKKLAFVPVYRPNTYPPDPPDVIPPDWPTLILQRALFDPIDATVTIKGISKSFKADRSLRA